MLLNKSKRLVRAKTEDIPSDVVLFAAMYTSDIFAMYSHENGILDRNTFSPIPV